MAEFLSDVEGFLENWWVPASVPAHFSKQIDEFGPVATQGSTVAYKG
jgi:hypothetical protein